MVNRSAFPSEIDVFLEHYEILASDIPNIQRYQTLLLKTPRTVIEEDELLNLKISLRDKIISAEDFNKFQDALVNMENFLSTEIDTYVKGKQVEVDQTITTGKQEIENKKQQVIAYLDDTNVGAVRNDIGDMSLLNSNVKDTLVNAINDIDQVNNQSIILNNGINTINSKRQSTINIMGLKGRTLINLLGNEGRTLTSKTIGLDSAKYYVFSKQNITTNIVTVTKYTGVSSVNLTWTSSELAALYEVSQTEYNTISTLTSSQLQINYHYVDNFKGIINPTIEVNGTRKIIPTSLHQLNGVYDEIFRDTDGKLKKRTNFRELVLDGSITWAFHTDFTGFKSIQFSFPFGYTSIYSTIRPYCVTKYDGKLLANRSPDQGADSLDFNTSNLNMLYITIADTDSGWGESYTPTVDEIKAYFMGWRMYQIGNYDTPYSSGTKGWWHIGVTGSRDITATTTLPTTVHSNNTNWQSHRLLYQVPNAIVEGINSLGEVVLNTNSNTVELNQGIIVKEQANPKDTGEGLRRANVNDSSLGFETTLTKYKVKRFLEVFKNGVRTNEVVLYENYSGKGQGLAQIQNFDPTAVYHVTYEILPELTVKVDTMSVTIPQSLRSVVENHTALFADHEERLGSLNTVYAKRLQQGWLPLPLKNGWIPNSTVAQPIYRKDEFGVVHIRGVITGGATGTNTEFATLPPGYRPLNVQTKPVISNNGSSLASYINIQTNGALALGNNVGNTWLIIDTSFETF